MCSMKWSRPHRIRPSGYSLFHAKHYHIVYSSTVKLLGASLCTPSILRQLQQETNEAKRIAADSAV